MSSGPGGARPTWQRPRGGDAGAVSGAGASVRAAGARAPARTEAHPTGRCEAAGSSGEGGTARGAGKGTDGANGSVAGGAEVARHQGEDGRSAGRHRSGARGAAATVAGSAAGAGGVAAGLEGAQGTADWRGGEGQCVRAAAGEAGGKAEQGHTCGASER